MIALLATGRAQATTYTSASGSACQGQFNSTAVKHDIDGTFGNSSGSTGLACPISLGTVTAAASVAAINVGYYDGNASSTFSCDVEQETYGGNTYVSTLLYTCGVAGGCPDSTTTYTGFGYLSFTGTDLPSHQLTHSVDDNYVVICTLPGTGASNSWITTYYTNS
jgi:hypothetical protein